MTILLGLHVPEDFRGVAWVTACRVIELTGVLLIDCVRSNNHVVIRLFGKGSKERFATFQADLYKRITEHSGSKTYLFESRNGGKAEEKDYRFSRTFVSQSIASLGWALLHRRVSAHAVRHSTLTFYYQQTHDLLKTQQLAGHSDSAVTARFYVHIANDPVETLGIMQLPGDAQKPSKGEAEGVQQQAAG